MRNDDEISASPRNTGIYIYIYIYIWYSLSKIVITWRWPLLAETCCYLFAIKYHHKTYYHSCVSWLKFTSPLVFLHTAGMTYLRTLCSSSGGRTVLVQYLVQYSTLYYTILYYTILYYTILYVLYNVIVHEVGHLPRVIFKFLKNQSIS